MRVLLAVTWLRCVHPGLSGSDITLRMTKVLTGLVLV
jgi:hypothetical protein